MRRQLRDGGPWVFPLALAFCILLGAFFGWLSVALIVMRFEAGRVFSSALYVFFGGQSHLDPIHARLMIAGAAGGAIWGAAWAIKAFREAVRSESAANGKNLAD